jgi:hypothetical protein
MFSLAEDLTGAIVIANLHDIITSTRSATLALLVEALLSDVHLNSVLLAQDR